MFDITPLDVSAGMGLCAMGLLTLNFLLGMMLSTAYKRSVYWKKLPDAVKKISIDDVHNWTAYVALLFVFMHLMPLFFVPKAGFTPEHIIKPLTAPKQPNIVLLGSLSLLALVIVIITTQKIIKKQLGFRLWKNIHLISYVTALLFVFHGILMDPELKDRPTDWLDAEKFFSEFCLLLLLAASFIRIRYHFKQKSKGAALTS